MKLLSLLLFLSVLRPLLGADDLELKEGFKLSLQSPKENYFLERKNNYLRFDYYGTTHGFYLKACHKPALRSLEGLVKKTVVDLQTWRLPAQIHRAQQGTFEVGARTYPYYREPSIQPALTNLPTKILALMRMGEELCKR